MYASGFRYCFTPLTGVLFAFPSRYWFTIGQLRVFSLGGWSPLVPKDCSDRVSRAPPYSISRHGRFRVRGCHPYGAPFQSASANADRGRRPPEGDRPRHGRCPSRLRADPLSLIATWGISVDFFSSGYLDISVPRVRFAHLWIQCAIASNNWLGFPIRKSPDQRLLPTPRGLSQAATSFIAFSCQGIHRMRLFA